MGFRNTCFQKNYFPETITTTPLLEPGTMEGKTGLILFLAAK